jgi:hypothetical protein
MSLKLRQAFFKTFQNTCFLVMGRVHNGIDLDSSGSGSARFFNLTRLSIMNIRTQSRKLINQSFHQLQTSR